MSATRFATSTDAERAFYAAFERADLNDMMNVWADDESIVCVHPMGPRLEGRRAIAESWRQIFSGGVGMRFELTEIKRSHDGDLAVHCVYENIRHGPRLAERSLVLATNVYRAFDGGWRLIVHHASPGMSMPSGGEEPQSTLH